MDGRTIREALLQASSLLASSGVEDGRHEAELLLLHLLGWDRSRLLLDGQREAFPAELASPWQAMLERRCAGEPAQYIIGEQEFYGLRFEVGPAVLIPRPETELLVEAIVKRVRLLWPGSGANRAYDASGEGASSEPASRLLADIGAGSGAIAVTAAFQLPGWRVAACDVSADALNVAGRNARRLGVAARVALYEGYLLEPLLADRVRVDVLVSNPPYIQSTDIPGLQREVRDHEPAIALDGGVDGLRFYRELVRQLGLMADAPRLVGFEVGQGQARQVAAMLREADRWSHFEIILDYAGIERHVLAWR